MVLATLFVLAIAARISGSSELLMATAVSWAIALVVALVAVGVALTTKRSLREDP